MLTSNDAGRAGLAALLCLVHCASLCAQEQAAIVETVDLLVPMSPTTVKTAGKTQIVYELHITNFLPVDVSLNCLQVRRADRPEPPIADYRDGELSARIGRPGLRRDLERPHVVGPGMRAIVYLWIDLTPEDSVIPPALRHRVELDILRPAGPIHATVDGGVSSVSRDAPVVLSPPLRGGPWTAVYDPLLRGGHRTVTYTIDGRARVPGRFAIDWIKLPASGVLERDPTPGVSDWNGYGSDVIAVADAVVAAARDGVPDNVGPSSAPRTPVALESASGNYVALDLGRGRFAFYEHLKHRSVAVKAGDHVKHGQVIGRLGNSGSSSSGPHLHFHVSNANSPLAAEGLPFVFTSFEHLGAFPSIEALTSGQKWLANGAGKVSARRLERPSAMSVVQFR